MKRDPSRPIPIGVEPPSRREFLRGVATAAVGVAATRCFPDVGGRWLEQRAECNAQQQLPPRTDSVSVADVVDPASVITEPAPTMEIVPAVVKEMLEEGLTALAFGVDPAWPELLPGYTMGMRIGLKVNCLNPTCGTSVPLVRALVETLQEQLGIAAEDLLVWDRRLDELTVCGFSEEAVGAPVLGTINSTTDRTGPGYEEAYCEVGGQPTRLSRILTEMTDITINCPVLKTHILSGVTGSLKNMYGLIDNPGDLHSNLQQALPALFALTPVYQRFHFTVIDALRAVVTGGTSSPVDAIPHRIVLSTDQLAADTYLLDLTNELRQRKAAEMGTTIDPVNGALTTWLDGAHQLGLGARTYVLQKIER